MHRLRLPAAAPLTARFEPELLGGVATLSGTALATEPLEFGALPDGAVAGQAPVPFKAIPYHLWDHREAGEMVVWLREATEA